MNANRAVRQPGLDELRLLAKVARMYHEKGIRQPRIAAELNLSQARVSRMLKQAVEVGIVHTVVTMPSGVHSDLEDELQGRYGLRDAVVVDTAGSGDEVLPALGSGTAAYLDMTLTGGHVIGISSWSETLISAVDRMPRKSVPVVDKVVQIVGGLGDAAVQMQATRLTARFAELTGAMPVYLPAPGLVGTPAVRRAMMNDVSVRDVLGTWGQLTDALVGNRQPRALAAAAAQWQRGRRGRPGRAAPARRGRGRLFPVLRRRGKARALDVRPASHRGDREGVAGGAAPDRGRRW